MEGAGILVLGLEAQHVILLLAAGTRGDVQPYIALAKGLQAAGQHPLLVTHPEFHTLAAAHGVDCAPLLGNPSELMTHSGGQSALTFDGNWLRSLQASLAYLRLARPVYKRMLESAWQACQSRPVRAVLFGLPAPWGLYLAEALGVPAVGAFLQPVTRTSAYPSPLLPSIFSAGSIYNHLTYRFVEQAVWLPWRRLTNHWRKHTLGLLPAFPGGPLAAMQTNGTPVLYAYSQHVSKRPSNWPENHHVTGYWFLDDPDRYQPPKDLLQFLENGPPPVYIGFGSPGVRDLQRVINITFSALRSSGKRAVLGLSPSALGGVSLPEDFFAAGVASHAWLLPRMAGMLHHGGAGTTAAGLRAGLPSLVIPMAVDQFFWAQRVVALGQGMCRFRG
jgi:sterol 3beta-glucosyltransferase